ncbi:uncharacterized protein C15orf57-like [Sinocyclocheilus grahami]|uniref:uncharacterized protein C15orf57-like n=1 Tax=Sinocyclocheilus grahami TaxID=75366 RepID=UPI0007AD30C7|nr:PREDICTED: uncharacterized protein C15orf57-like [Sinocyclocheilus grahami]
MIDDFESHAVRSTGDLWSEVCSSLPEPQEQDGGQFTDSFEPSSPGNPQTNSPRAFFCPWEPMADSEVYIASLENRLKRIKGQSNEVTSREMLRSLSQANALEQFKRWLSPERVAINAEELEYLLLPTQNSEAPASSTQTDKPCEGEECPSPEK